MLVLGSAAPSFNSTKLLFIRVNRQKTRHNGAPRDATHDFRHQPFLAPVFGLFLGMYHRNMNETGIVGGKKRPLKNNKQMQSPSTFQDVLFREMGDTHLWSWASLNQLKQHRSKAPLEEINRPSNKKWIKCFGYTRPETNIAPNQWLFLVPLKGGRWHIIPQLLAVYTTYILPSGGLYATYHLLGEPETTIDST